MNINDYMSSFHIYKFVSLIVFICWRLDIMTFESITNKCLIHDNINYKNRHWGALKVLTEKYNYLMQNKLAEKSYAEYIHTQKISVGKNCSIKIMNIINSRLFLYL